ncbi:helix-turn-helix transcriptional regulator [Burkholderia gladioli]|uniref:helix-turn-helix domain-containing protein n=1 Tax=Burkholderia gladioli TaxID=28095 RepID=UPI00313342B9
MDKKEKLILEKIGKTIAKKRKVAGFTQEEVADKLAIGNEAVSRIERGLISPGIFKLYELADMFECGVETFLIEGSRRPADQAGHMENLLSKLSAPDRSLVVAIVERLARRLTPTGKDKGEKSGSGAGGKFNLAEDLLK